jgi:hypothetical protein
MKARILVLLGIAFLIAASGSLLCTAMGDRSWIVRGQAFVGPDAVAHVGGVSIVCSGFGGPLETSGVYGHPIILEDRGVQVFCRSPQDVTSFAYEEFTVQSGTPRNIHAYVWLEPHEELASHCADANSPLVSVDIAELRGMKSSMPADRPCFRPDPDGSLGYAVGFRRRWALHSGLNEEHVDIHVRPRGYP